MDDFGNLFTPVNNDPVTACFFSEYNEKLEAEYIMRTRRIFDEFVCPKTGTVLVSTFGELLHGVSRLWTLTQEMKGFTEEIHDRILNLPLLFILALFRLVEKEYTKEDFEKTPADPQLGDSLLALFLDIHEKLANFKKQRALRVLLNTCLMYLRYLLATIGADQRIRRIKWSELNVKSIKIMCPIRKRDMKTFLECLRHFRKSIHPKYSKKPVPYKLTFINWYPEIMEPTLERQNEISEFFFQLSLWMIIFSVMALSTGPFLNYINTPAPVPTTRSNGNGSNPANLAKTEDKKKQDAEEDDEPVKVKVRRQRNSYFTKKLITAKTKEKTKESSKKQPPPSNVPKAKK